MIAPVQIPLGAVAFQSVQAPLSGQLFQLDIQQRSTGLYMTITMNGTRIIAAVLCQDRTWIVRRGCYGLPGDFTFLDTLSTTDPVYSGLRSQYILIYQEGQNVG